MHNVLFAIHVLLAVGLIGLVLIQQGKGADMGAAFGAGASGTVFGSRGSGSFLSRVTAYVAAAFFASSLFLAYLSSQAAVDDGSIVDRIESSRPATPVVPQDGSGAAGGNAAGSGSGDVPPVVPQD